MTTGGAARGGAPRSSGGGRFAAQPASVATITSPTNRKNASLMGLILLEALGALVALGLIVWWTMFSGRRRGELHDDEAPHDETPPRGPPAPPA